jgi:hypothetical protein
VEYRNFSHVHILALVCDELRLAQRLLQRPSWRGAADPGFIDDHIRYNRWFRRNTRRGASNTHLTLSALDTTDLTPDAVAGAILNWMSQHSGRKQHEPHAAMV